ncbi:hypothetical protein NA56DRAFT_744873 [Hyaloscypha hepaticicola]|uniref:Uncharacterized protein n=1 Tax=Hyaloscypha hepaticicola TaxID=2082293 RepID=A0A2J6QHY2_9HELO|nr:hypothetical protein NA56DRAFT_744873 [Hyaloscypha hepaticicola]
MFETGLLKEFVGHQLDPRISIAQLHDPKELHPISLIGFNLRSVPVTSFSAPLALSEFVEPHDERNLQLLLTPKYGFTDLHMDVPALLGLLGRMRLNYILSNLRFQPRMLARENKFCSVIATSGQIQILNSQLLHHRINDRIIMNPSNFSQIVYYTGADGTLKEELPIPPPSTSNPLLATLSYAWDEPPRPSTPLQSHLLREKRTDIRPIPSGCKE